jgi:acetyl-CoA acetyltransferase
VKVGIRGVGTSHFGKQPETPLTELAWTAVTEALEDAQVDDIEAVYVGTVFGAPGVAQRVLHGLGIVGVPIMTLENACASGTSAFVEAQYGVASGRYGRVLALGLEQMTAAFDGAIHPEATDAEGRSGMALPSLYAMAAQRYLHQGLVTLEELASVAVKNHGHAIHNDRAQYGGEHSIEQVLGSTMIADPLTLLQCCPISDGAAAAVIAPARDDDVRIRSAQVRSGGLWDHRSPHVWGFDLVRDTARRAYEEAGIDADEIDLVEVHDAFTIGEITTVEALGLVEVGQAGRAAAEGETALGGRIVVNPSGGLLSRGHPLGATGLAQIAEATWQLRGETGRRQVEGARTAVVETMGGGVSGIDGNACVVTVLGG